MRGEAAREGSDYCERQRRRMAREAARRKRQRKRLLRFIIVLLVKPTGIMGHPMQEKV